MDLERIKQSFRIRSGRSQKQKKRKGYLSDTPEKTKPTTNGIVRPTSEVEHKSEIPAAESPIPETELQEHLEVADDLAEVKESEGTLNGTVNQVDDKQSRDGDTTETQSAVPDNTVDVPAEHAEMSKEENAPVEQDMPKASHQTGTGSSDTEDFDLQPPKPKAKPPSLESISELLWSSGHLDTLLHYPPQLARFSAFLQKYLPDCYPYLAQYLETQKAIKAIEYANAIAEGLSPTGIKDEDLSLSRKRAAQLDSDFEKISNASFKALVHDALPGFINYSLIKIVSECLINEITGRSTPVMRDLVGGLSEVFCLTDPQREDNPIIYASEEFYRLTRYGPEDVINNNCRFLQGKKTNPDSPIRLKTAIEGGQEITETLLNYRRDGRPFLNMLMIAPLHDKRGKLKYHIGAQIDVTGLVEGGRALDGFQRYLNRRADDARKAELEAARKPLNEDQSRKKNVLAKLRNLSESFDLEESAIVQAHSRSNSLDREDDDNRSVGSTERMPRRYYADSDASDDDGDDEDSVNVSDGDQASKWKLGVAGDGGLSGKLPGVYESFMLLKPAPSLRIVFVSPKLRQFKGVLQTPFMSHVAAPTSTLTGLSESLKSGVPVSAKIHFSTQSGSNKEGTMLRSGTKHEDGKNGFAVWVSCTPMIDSDDRVGVWMCVIVEKSKVGSMRRQRSVGVHESQSRGRRPSKEDITKQNDSEPMTRTQPSDEVNHPIKPVRVGSRTRIAPAKDKISDDATKPVTAKNLRERESVYFDTEPNRGSDADESESPSDPYRLNGLPEKESVTPDEHLNQIEVHSLTHGPQTVIPERSYEQPNKASKPYGAPVPGLQRLTSCNASDDGYISVQSPQAQKSSPRNDERILIEEDSDFVSMDDNVPAREDDIHHHYGNLDVGSPNAVHRLTVEPKAEADEYPIDHELPPSVPSSVYLPDDEEDSEPEKPDEEESSTNQEDGNDLAKSEETLRAPRDESSNLRSDQRLSHSNTEKRDISCSPSYNQARSDADVTKPEDDIDNTGLKPDSNLPDNAESKDEAEKVSSDHEKSVEPTIVSEKDSSEKQVQDTETQNEPKSHIVRNELELQKPRDSEDLPQPESEQVRSASAQRNSNRAERGDEQAEPDKAETDQQTTVKSQGEKIVVDDSDNDSEEKPLISPASDQKKHSEEKQLESSKPNSDIENLQAKLEGLGTDLEKLTIPTTSPHKGNNDQVVTKHTDEYENEDDTSTKTPTLGHKEFEESEELPANRSSSQAEVEASKPDGDRDSAILMDSPAHHRRILASPPPEPLQSPPLSPARQSNEVEPDLQYDQPALHYTDVENWLEDGRPASSHDPNNTRAPMDYLRVHSARWAHTRRPRLNLDMIEQANKGYKGRDDDTEDPCVRSPYSVD